jgi:L-seryl-tRNA(Ser) seleniumtransferase
MSNSSLTRRELFRRGGILGTLLAFPGALKAAAQSPTATGGVASAGAGALKLGTDIYQSIGVRPLINARGTFTIIRGSTMLPDVRAAMDQAAQ